MDIWIAMGALGTAVTAAIAMIAVVGGFRQLGYMRAQRDAELLYWIYQNYSSDDMHESMKFLWGLADEGVTDWSTYRDKYYRTSADNHRRRVLHYFVLIGHLAERGLLDKDICYAFFANPVQIWRRLRDIEVGRQATFENMQSHNLMAFANLYAGAMAWSKARPSITPNEIPPIDWPGPKD